MFRLSKMTDYGVVVLGQLAGQRGRLLSAPEVAEATAPRGRDRQPGAENAGCRRPRDASHRGAHAAATNWRASRRR